MDVLTCNCNLPDHLWCRRDTISMWEYLSCCTDSSRLTWCSFKAEMQWKASDFKAACVVYSWGCFRKMSLLLIPEMEFHPTDTANSIAGRCMKVPKQMGECHYLISQWVIHGLFPSCSLSASAPLCLELSVSAVFFYVSTIGDVHI